MAGAKPTEPADLLGAYRALDDVPDRHRLREHARAYDGRDAWGEWAAEEVLPGCDSERAERTARRHERRWKSHMEGRRHHALATPADIDAYCAGPLASNSGRVAAGYFRRLVAFYDHLLTSTEHPHVYSPALMAAAGDGPASDMWVTAEEER
jgi:hypothetical protein